MKDRILVEAHAKINWTLEVFGKRPDGYHELRSIVLPVSLHDDLEIESAGEFAIVGCEGIALEKNLIYKAAVRLAAAVGHDRPDKVRITVTKRIPAGAGLGGGSSDAAATILALNRFCGYGLDEPRLLEIGAEVGSDVPALMMGAPVMMEGRGERVRRLEEHELKGVPESDSIVLLTPPIFSSTAAVYGEFRQTDRGRGRNDLEPAALRLYPQIAEAMEELKARGLKDVAMSGSGSTVYGVDRR